MNTPKIIHVFADWVGLTNADHIGELRVQQLGARRRLTLPTTMGG